MINTISCWLNYFENFPISNGFAIEHFSPGALPTSDGSLFHYVNFHHPLYWNDMDFAAVFLNVKADYMNKLCPAICAKVYRPVCAFNDKLQCYKTKEECFLKSENCRRRHYNEPGGGVVQGECDPKVHKLCCPNNCPLDGPPVCGFNGNSFSKFINRCDMDVHNCKEKIMSPMYKQVDFAKCS
uniref:Kazal-like domain-containing protein n=1 Tax=Megaselia scalaris TaxID=36166 RepID=T1GR21_MEGSC